MSGTSSVWADPAALDRFAAGTTQRAGGLHIAAAVMRAAVAAWNLANNEKYGFHIEDFGHDVNELVGTWVRTDSFVGQVAAAFREADGPGPSTGTIFSTEQTVDTAMVANSDKYRPIDEITNGDPAEWARLVGANVCYAGGKYHGGGFITAPDGKRYPLVIAETNDGKNADDGGPGDVSTLDGSDPGWYRTGVYSGNQQLYSVDKTGALVGGLLVGATGGTAPANVAGSINDYKKLVIGDGRPKYYGDGKVPYKIPGGVDKLDNFKGGGARGAPVDPLPRGMAGRVGAGMFVANAVNVAASSLSSAEKNAHGVYQLVTERNADGRERARLVVYQLANGKDGKKIIIPEGISKEGKYIDHKVIKYRDHVDTGDPVHDDDPKDDHVFKGIKDKSLLGVIGRWKEPTYQDP